MEEALSAVGVLPDDLRWRTFLENLFMCLGGLALSFAVLFFIAYNWNAMGRFAKFATNAFFFQEGHTSVYQRARYGQFRVDEKGELLLTSMHVDKLKKLEPIIKEDKI